MRRSLIFSLLVFGLLAPNLAQNTLVNPAPTPGRTMNLQAALLQIQPTPPGVTLTVGPQWEDIARDRKPPTPKASVSEVAALYDKATRKFGGIRAIAPPTMTLLNDAPGMPNPFDGMSYYDVLPLLTSSLSESQWASLTGESGLSVASLTATQRQLFAQLLPDGQLKVQPWTSVQFGSSNGKEPETRDLSGELMTARLRIKQTAEVMLPIQGEERSYYGGENARPPGENVWKLLPSKNNWGNSQDEEYGQRVRADVPNAPKKGQLDFKQPALQTAIPFAGLKTVGDLFARVAKLTHLELYAERRWEHKTLLILGTGGQAAPAADLLQAAAFCLSATFRQVGPAYVMTDDIVGLGTKMQRWYEFEKMADALRQKPLEAARADADKRFGKSKIDAFGDPLALSDVQTKDNSYSAQIPLTAMTPDQQKTVRAMAETWNKDVAANRSGSRPIDLDGKFQLNPAINLQLIVPSLPSPIDMGVQVGRGSLFSTQPLQKTPEERHAEQEKSIREYFASHADEFVKNIREHPEGWDFFSKEFPAFASEFLAAHPEVLVVAKKAQTEKPTLAEILKRVPNRAALVRPRTVEDADKDVATARQLGLTQLWIDAFSDGKPHADMVAEAVKAAKGSSLKIFAIIDALAWGQKPPAEARDLNVLGETSADAVARRDARRALQGGRYGGDDWRERDLEPSESVAVNPLAPTVHQTLLGVVQSLKDTPGVTGIVLRETAPPGYELQGETSAGISTADDSSSLTLGYNFDMRLAFLRKAHADPIDVFPPNRFLKANVDLSNFMYDGSISDEVHGEWNKFRRDSNLALLREMRDAARPLRVLVRRRGPSESNVINEDGTRPSDPGWYAAWDNPKLPPPTRYGNSDAPGAGAALANQPGLTQARAQSPLVLQAVTTDSLAQMSKFGQLRQWQKTPPPGLVIDAGTQRLAQAIK